MRKQENLSTQTLINIDVLKRIDSFVSLSKKENSIYPGATKEVPFDNYSDLLGAVNALLQTCKYAVKYGEEMASGSHIEAVLCYISQTLQLAADILPLEEAEFLDLLTNKYYKDDISSRFVPIEHL